MCSLALLLRNLTNQDQTYVMRNDGFLGHLECSFWNQGVLIWGGFLASTYNLLCSTIERYRYYIYFIEFFLNNTNLTFLAFLKEN